MVADDALTELDGLRGRPPRPLLPPVEPAGGLSPSTLSLAAVLPDVGFRAVLQELSVLGDEQLPAVGVGTPMMQMAVVDAAPLGAPE